MSNLNGLIESISNKFKAIAKQFLVIFFYYVLVVTLQLSFKKYLVMDNVLINNVCYLFLDLIILIIFIFMFRKTIIPEFYDFKKNGKKYITKSFIYWILGLFIMVISNAIISSFIGLPTNEEVNRTILTKLPLYSIIAVVIIGPITEELMTRVILKDSFKNKWIYAILSGLIFGSLHLISIETTAELFYIIPYSALGVSFALMYHDTNNIWTNISFHSLHNLISILLIFIGV